MAIDTFDEFLLVLGTPGRYRIILFAMLFGCMFYVGMNSMFILYTAYVPPHRCKMPSNWTWPLNESIPLTEVKGQLKYDQCSMYIDPTNHSLGTSECLYGWEYIMDEGENFVSTEFDLVCHRRYILNLGMTVQYAGITAGGIIFGIISDKIGRRKTLVVSMVTHTVFSIALAFTNSAPLFFVCASLLGVFIQGLHSASYTYSSELFHARQRTAQGVVIGLPWSLSLFLLSWIFWWFLNWRHVQLLIGCSAIIGSIYIWFLPESLRWHMARGDLDDVTHVMQRFFRCNRTVPPPTLENDLKMLARKMADAQAKSSKGSIMDLFRSPKIRLYSLVMGFTYCISTAIYLGVAVSIPKLGTNKYSSYIITSTFEFSARLCAIYIFNRFGRRRPLSSFVILCSIFSLLSSVVRYWQVGGESVSSDMSLAFAMLGNIFLTFGFSAVGLYISELYPTLMRALGLGFCVTLGRIGSVISPQILLLDMVWAVLPMLVYSIFTFIAGLLILLLPETNKKPLTDCVGDAGALRKASVTSK